MPNSEQSTIEVKGPQDSPETCPEPAREACGLGWLFLAYVAVRLPFLFMVPMQQAPDEFAHYWVIKFMKENLRLPSAAEVAAGGPSAVYGSLPQLGYVPHVLASFLFPPELLPLAERFGSLACGAVMVYAAWRIGRIVFSSSRLAASAVPLVVILHPQIAFLHAYANNDSTSSAIASVLVWLSLDTLKRGLCLRRSAVMGALVGWLAVTKYTGLAVLPAVALSMVASCVVNATTAGAALSSVGVASLLAIGLSSWWFLRTAAEFNGDFMGTRTMYQTWATTFNRDLEYNLSPWRIIKDHRWWRMTFYSFWGLFGYMDRYLWKPVYFVYYAPFIAGAAAFIWNAFRGKLNGDRKQVLSWIVIGLVPATNLVAMVWASTKNLGGPQGRYLFTSEIPIACLLVGGLLLLGGAWGRRSIVAFLVWNAVVCAGSFIYLYNSYGGFRLSPL